MSNAPKTPDKSFFKSEAQKDRFKNNFVKKFIGLLMVGSLAAFVASELDVQPSKAMAVKTIYATPGEGAQGLAVAGNPKILGGTEQDEADLVSIETYIDNQTPNGDGVIQAGQGYKVPIIEKYQNPKNTHSDQKS